MDSSQHAINPLHQWANWMYLLVWLFSKVIASPSPVGDIHSIHWGTRKSRTGSLALIPENFWDNLAEIHDSHTHLKLAYEKSTNEEKFSNTGADLWCLWIVGIQLKMLLFMCLSTEHGLCLDIFSSSAVKPTSIWVQGSQDQEWFLKSTVKGSKPPLWG